MPCRARSRWNNVTPGSSSPSVVNVIVDSLSSEGEARRMRQRPSSTEIGAARSWEPHRDQVYSRRPLTRTDRLKRLSSAVSNT